MVKGRRTRQVTSTGQLVTTSTVVDDTASPKRKDFKYDNNVGLLNSNKGNDNAVKPPNSGTSQSAASMMLRGGRMKANGITKYLTPIYKPVSSFTSKDVVVPSFIDLTDENTCDSFEGAVSTLDFSADKSKQSNNIFLQEPVLSLDFDKTTPDKSRITIKSSFLNNEIQNTFSSPKCDPMWGSAVSDIELKPELQEYAALDLSKPTQVTDIDSTTFLNQDSSDSGDSGVVILPTADHDPSMTDGKRRKPATPHRILCPSPVKIPIVASPSTALAHLNIQSKRAPRKNAKPKRRLNTKELENALEESVIETNSINALLNAAAVIDAAANKETIDKKKLVLNTAINPTAQQNTSNNQTYKHSDGCAIAKVVNKSGDTGTNKKLTDFFQVRRSVRKTKKEVQWERERDIETAILEERETGLKIAHFEGKGRGIITTKPFKKGEFVVEYIGDLITVAEARHREQVYAEDDSTGCYMYYFKHLNVQHCIDATAESGKLGRLVNHSRNGNLMTKTVSINKRPHLVLIAKDDLPEGVEITYDYGDRSKESLQHHPWLAF